jgi:diguanylate cyclase (GGDEF)-like protein
MHIAMVDFASSSPAPEKSARARHRAHLATLAEGGTLTRMALAMGALLLLYGCWQALDLTPHHRALVGDVFFYPVGMLAIHAAWRASQRCSLSARLQSSWRLLALASVSYLGGDVAQTVYELVGKRPYPSVADALYLTFYPLMLVGLLRFPSAHRSAAEKLRRLLDLAVVAIGGSAVVIYVVLGPAAVRSGPSSLQTAFSIAYPVGDMVLLVGLATLLLSRPLPCSHLALRLLAAGLGFYVAADLVYGYLTLHSTYHGGDPVDTLWMVAIAFLGVAAAAQRSPDDTRQIPAAHSPHSSTIPYVAIAVAFVLLGISQRHDPLFPDKSLTLTAVLLTALVSIRQFLTQRDLIHSQQEISHQSLHDALTGLPNRVLALDRTQQMLARARRQQSPVAALFVDLDGFKNVNDTLGHAAGDRLLRIVAERLTTVIRDADTAARFGGDEFVVLLEGSTPEHGPEFVARRLLEVLRQPYDLDETRGRRQPSISASVGIAVGIQLSADELLRNADLALYEAKAAGRDHYVLFESSMQSASERRVTLEMDLGDAVESEQLFLLYQPMFDLSTQDAVGVEALVRWRHPIRGIVSPEEFIPIAEDSGLIAQIGRWVLQTACQRAAIWHRHGHPIGISVNVSARQLDDDRLLADVRETLADNDLDPAALTLEITETALMRDPGATIRRLGALKELGVRIAIDDFGTGYSSLAYVRQFPADSLKIDRSFIAGLPSSEASAALIHTVVQLGKALDIQILAEGIEDQDQLEALQREHCDQGQGFLFSRPLDVDAVEAFLDAAMRQHAHH